MYDFYSNASHKSYFTLCRTTSTIFFDFITNLRVNCMSHAHVQALSNTHSNSQLPLESNQQQSYPPENLSVAQQSTLNRLQQWQQQLEEFQYQYKAYPYDINWKLEVNHKQAHTYPRDIDNQKVVENALVDSTSHSLEISAESSFEGSSGSHQSIQRITPISTPMPDYLQNSSINYDYTHSPQHHKPPTSSPHSLWKRQGFTPLPYKLSAVLNESSVPAHSSIQSEDGDLNQTQNHVRLDFKIAHQIQQESEQKQSEQQSDEHHKKPSVVQSVTQILIDPLDDEALYQDVNMLNHIDTPVAQKLAQHHYDLPSYEDPVDSSIYNESIKLDEIGNPSFAGQASMPPQPQPNELSEGWSTLLNTDQPNSHRSQWIKRLITIFIIVGLGILVAYFSPF